MPAANVHEDSPACTDDVLEEIWSNLVEAVGRVSQFTRTYLLEAHPVSFKNKLFVIGFDPEFEDHIGLVDHSKNHALLQTKLEELGHAQVQFKFVKAEAPEARIRQTAAAPAQSDTVAARAFAPGPARSAAPKTGNEKPLPVPFDKESFKNDPLIQKALEIFRGQIVEVRA